MTSYEREDLMLRRTVAMWTTIAVITIALFIAALFACVPRYRVWAEGKRGEAEYMRAEQNRRMYSTINITLP